jgi:hypothetical protein
MTKILVALIVALAVTGGLLIYQARHGYNPCATPGLKTTGLYGSGGERTPGTYAWDSQTQQWWRCS